MKRAVKIVKLGDFSLPNLRQPLEELSSEKYCVFILERNYVKVPEPDYKIGGFIEEYSFALLLSMMQSYRQGCDLKPEDLAIGVINRRLEKNYFGCASAEQLSSVISICDVEDVIKPLNLNQYLVSEIVRHAVALLENHWWHPEPRRCFYDFCGDKRDIVASYSSGALCDACGAALTDAAKELLERNASLNLRFEHNIPNQTDRILFVSADPSNERPTLQQSRPDELNASDREKPHPDLVLVTVNEHETKAIHNAFFEATGAEGIPVPLDGRLYHNLGTINGTTVYHAISEMGSSGPGAMQQVVDKAIRLRTGSGHRYRHRLRGQRGQTVHW